MSSRISAALEACEWVRYTDIPLNEDALNRLVVCVDRLYQPALKELLLNLEPQRIPFKAFVQSRVLVPAKHVDIRCTTTHILIPFFRLGFAWMFLNTRAADLHDSTMRHDMVDSLTSDGTSLVQMRRAVCLVNHTLANVTGRSETEVDLLTLLSHILIRARDQLPTAEWFSLQEFTLTQCPSIIALSSSTSLSDAVQTGSISLVQIQNSLVLIFDHSVHRFCPPSDRQKK